MSCGNKKQIRGGYIDVPSFSNIINFTNTKTTTTNSINFDKVESYEQFLEKVKLLYQENPEILKYSLDGVLNKIKINIEDVKVKLDTVNLENPEDNQIRNLLNTFMIKEQKDYDEGIRSYYDKKFQEKRDKLQKEKDECIKECDEKIENLQKEIKDKQTKINNIESKKINTKSKLLIEKESLEKDDVQKLEAKKTEYEREFATKLELVDTQQEGFHNNVKKFILENQTPKNMSPVATNNIKQLEVTSVSNTNTNTNTITLPIQGGSRQKSSNIHTFYMDYQQKETKGGGTVKQIFRL